MICLAGKVLSYSGAGCGRNIYAKGIFYKQKGFGKMPKPFFPPCEVPFDGITRIRFYECNLRYKT
jgi:hypothetical protein